MTLPAHSLRLKAVLWRWRELVAGLVLSALSLWLALSSFGATRVLGFGLLVLALALTLAGVQRARFRRGAGGPGIVLVREAQVTYFGPGHGGAVDAGSLVRLELDGASGPVAQWLLTEEGRAPLAVPVTAEGAEALFDVFASLPGIRTEAMLAALQAPAPGIVLIWGRPAARPRLALVH